MTTRSTRSPSRCASSGTSDRNFYDRYYFNIHGDRRGLGHRRASCSPSSGSASTPTWAWPTPSSRCCGRGDHRVVRSSKILGADRMDTSVGPIRVEVLEGLEQVRVILEPNEWGLELDAVYDGFSEAHLESRHFDRQFTRVTFDTTRFAQVGSWTGSLKVGDREVGLDPRPLVGLPGPVVGGPSGRRARASGHPGHRHRGRLLLDLRPGAVRGPCHGHHHPGATERRAGHAGCPPGLPASGPGGRPSGWGGPSTSSASSPGRGSVTGATLSLLRRPRTEDGRSRRGDVAGLPVALMGSGLRARARLEARDVPGRAGRPGTDGARRPTPSYFNWALTEYAARFT